MSPNYYSSAEKFRVRRRRHRRYSSGSDGIPSVAAVYGGSSSRDLDSERDGRRDGGRRRRRKGGGGRDDDEIKDLIITFFNHFSSIYKMVSSETQLIKKQSCMDSRSMKRYYTSSHKLLPKLDECQSPLQLLRTVSKEAALVGETLNKKFRASFFEHHAEDEDWDRKGHRSSRRGNAPKDYRDNGHYRGGRRRDERSYRRQEPRERRDRYERKGDRRSRRYSRNY